MLIFTIINHQCLAQYAQDFNFNTNLRSGRTYTDIARIVNPNQYAHVGTQPYPGQPFWPQGR